MSSAFDSGILYMCETGLAKRGRGPADTPFALGPDYHSMSMYNNTFSVC